ncbi:MAG: YicC/YloC family endoribonuclease [Arenicellales bacterium]
MNSMTAFARYEQQIDQGKLIWEIRSVNHRYLDGHFKLPENVRQSEKSLKLVLSEKLSRGRVDISLNIKVADDILPSLNVNAETLEQWAAWQQDVLRVVKDAAPLSVMELLSIDNILERPEHESSLDEKMLVDSFKQALVALIEQRAAEGGRLKKGLFEKLRDIEHTTEKLQQNMPRYEQAHQGRWQARLEEMQTASLDPVRLHQEVALLISKADVTEELDRLNSHINEFDAALNSDAPVGRRLDFLLQEFNREANTLGSKSIHKDISNACVEIKVLIDQLKEQVQNIE